MSFVFLTLLKSIFFAEIDLSRLCVSHGFLVERTLICLNGICLLTRLLILCSNSYVNTFIEFGFEDVTN